MVIGDALLWINTRVLEIQIVDQFLSCLLQTSSVPGLPVRQSRLPGG